MQLSPFWRSVWAAGAYLLGIGLLNRILMMLFGVLTMPFPVAATVVNLLLVVLVPVVGTVLYLDWKWSWKLEHIGMPRQLSAVGWLALGLVGGFAGHAVAHAVSALAQGQAVLLPALTITHPIVMAVALAIALGVGIATEMVFRGALVSRFQADLSGWEMIAAAVAIPFAWRLISRTLLGAVGPDPFIESLDGAALSVFLTLLYLRTDSVWLSAGILAGVQAASKLFSLTVTPQGGLIVWGVGAAVLLLLEVMRQNRMPRRVQQQRGRGTQWQWSQTRRGPWGPH